MDANIEKTVARTLSDGLSQPAGGLWRATEAHSGPADADALSHEHSNADTRADGYADTDSDGYRDHDTDGYRDTNRNTYEYPTPYPLPARSSWT